MGLLTSGAKARADEKASIAALKALRHQKTGAFLRHPKLGAFLSHPKQEFFCGTETGPKLSWARACPALPKPCFAEALSAAKGQRRGSRRGHPALRDSRS